MGHIPWCFKAGGSMEGYGGICGRQPARGFIGGIVWTYRDVTGNIKVNLEKYRYLYVGIYRGFERYGRLTACLWFYCRNILDY